MFTLIAVAITWLVALSCAFVTLRKNLTMSFEHEYQGEQRSQEVYKG